MGKIGDLVNRIISPLLNRSTDSQTVADPRRGRIGYVGNITLISQLINDAGYSTDNGTVTDVHITAGTYTRVTDDAPDPDEFIPNFKVPTKTSHLVNDGNENSPLIPKIPQYGTGTITGLTKNNSSSGVTIENGVAKIKIGTDVGDYTNDAFSTNPGTMTSLKGVAGTPLVEESRDSRYPSGTAFKYIIHIPTSTEHVTDETYVNNTVFNSYKFVFENITVNENVITPIGTLYAQQQPFIDSNFRIYKFGKIVFIYGLVPTFTITTANINVLNNMQILEIKKSDIFMVDGSNVQNKNIVGNGMLYYTNADGYQRYVPIYIEYSKSLSENAKLSMVTCDPLTGDKIDRTYKHASTAGSFSAWWHIGEIH